jgi:hypothetical protein
MTRRVNSLKATGTPPRRLPLAFFLYYHTPIFPRRRK